MLVNFFQTSKLAITFGMNTSKNTRNARCRIIPLPCASQSPEAFAGGLLSTDACRAILCKDGAEYTDSEIETVSRVLWALAQVDYAYHSKLFALPANSTTIIPLNAAPDDQQPQSHSLRPRLYRRTG